MNFLNNLEKIISQRIDSGSADSYISQLVQKGLNKVVQKVGEEAGEVVIEAKDKNDDLFKNEAADLLFHLMILLKIKGT
ncbi:phosphoribosyl-ATP diphosphatase [Chryseobacterium salipaludis]|uniref:phosphoribosyl-ATP diphosphatase n=1 Tax=Chryseobacterium TaxID=59732 RepID=UPI001FF3EA2B|nr:MULTISPECIES: phosphoribosyl-ATP diphosphatase [Chryseobacterium]MCJ8496740.1 phosphoribosyl-ATP diphosphatase [Chryseobacterium salipaludis]MCX3296221.1 phosphoribosyl-ATP diphosphatase [Planobacterium sp. JC490]